MGYTAGIGETRTVEASALRKLNKYPATEMAIGSPSGAIRSSFTISPGVQPISNNFNAMCLSVKESMMALCPIFNCAKFFKAFIFAIINVKSTFFLAKMRLNQYLKDGIFRADALFRGDFT